MDDTPSYQRVQNIIHTEDDAEQWEKLELAWRNKTPNEKRQALKDNLEKCKRFIRKNGLEHEYNMGEFIE